VTGNKQPGTEATIRVPKKIYNMKDCRKYEKDGTEKADFHAGKKGGKKSNPAKQSFAHLRKKFDKL
jgi:hypothetical protein